MKPELKRWDCADHDPIEDWLPVDGNVCYELTLHIGAAGSDAADLYRVTVATPGGAKRVRARAGVSTATW